MAEEGMLYVSRVVDGKEVLKPAEISDVKRWLYDAKFSWMQAKHIVVPVGFLRSVRDMLNELEKSVAPFEIEKKLTDG